MVDVVIYCAHPLEGSELPQVHRTGVITIADFYTCYYLAISLHIPSRSHDPHHPVQTIPLYYPRPGDSGLMVTRQPQNVTFQLTTPRGGPCHKGSDGQR